MHDWLLSTCQSIKIWYGLYRDLIGWFFFSFLVNWLSYLILNSNLNEEFQCKSLKIIFSRLNRSMITQYIINCFKTFNTCISCMRYIVCCIVSWIYASKKHFINNTKDHHFICKQHTQQQQQIFVSNITRYNI